jgi:hypothetical protein
VLGSPVAVQFDAPATSGRRGRGNSIAMKTSSAGWPQSPHEAPPRLPIPRVFRSMLVRVLRHSSPVDLKSIGELEMEAGFDEHSVGADAVAS